MLIPYEEGNTVILQGDVRASAKASGNSGVGGASGYRVSSSDHLTPSAGIEYPSDFSQGGDYMQLRL